MSFLKIKNCRQNKRKLTVSYDFNPSLIWCWQKIAQNYVVTAYVEF